jgi:hypothetical protein
VFKFVGDAGVEQVAAIDCHHGLCENLCTTTISVSEGKSMTLTE